MSGPMTAHTAVTRGIERALADLGVDLVGCSPSVLSGHVIKELREAGLLRMNSAPDEVRKSAIEALTPAFHAKYCVHNGVEDCGSDCHDDAVLAVDTLIKAGKLAAPDEDQATVERSARAIHEANREPHHMTFEELTPWTRELRMDEARAALRAARGTS